MARYLSSYRWELWLIIGIPTIVGVIGTIAGAIVLAQLDRLDIDWGFISPVSVVWSFVSMLLLAASYPFVRRTGREFLKLLWGYSIVSSVISFVSIVAFVTTGVTLYGTSIGITLGLTLIMSLIAGAVHFLVLLWFTRRASRLSLTYAFFLVVFVFLPASGFVPRPTVLAGDYTPVLVGGVVTVCVMLVRVWLLGNFEARGPGFRRNAVIGLVAATVTAWSVGALVGGILGYGDPSFPVSFFGLAAVDRAVNFGVAVAGSLAALLAVLGIVWLVRVREPRAEASAVEQGAR